MASTPEFHEATDPRIAALRPLSKIETFSSVRHHIGIYRCVVVTARYEATSPSSQRLSSPKALFPALAAVVAAHPMLRVSILNEDLSDPRFGHVPEIDLKNHVDFRTLSADTEAEYDAKLADLQGWLHDQLFPDIDTRPPWRILVVKPEGGVPASRGEKRSEDVIFGFHHSLSGGTGGKTFHEDLVKNLNTLAAPTDAEPQSVLPYPEIPTLPEGQDDAIAFTISTPYMARILWAHFCPSWLQRKKPDPWGGKAISYSLPYETKVRPVDISAETLKSLLNGCKANSTSLQGLIQSLALTSLTQRLSDDVSYMVSSSPISLLPWLVPTADQSLKDTLRVLITTLNHEHKAPVLRAIRDVASNPAELEKLVWKNAVRIKADLTKRVETMPANESVSLLKYISDFFSYFRAKDGEPRDLSWEVSNIGVIKNPGHAERYKLTRSQFTNGAMVAGPAIGLNVSSIAGEQLNIAISWQKDIVTEELINGIAEDMSKWSTRFAQHGCLFV